MMEKRYHILHRSNASSIPSTVILTTMAAIGLVSGPCTTELMQPTDRDLRRINYRALTISSLDPGLQPRQVQTLRAKESF
jgi:hypothetical protein